MDQALRQAVLHRLDLLDQVAADETPEHVLPLARTELQRLAESWRALLELHQPDDNGRCCHCRGTVRGRRWPCSVWLAAHHQLLGDGAGTEPRRSSRLAKPLRIVGSAVRSCFGRGDPTVLPETVVVAGHNDPAHWPTATAVHHDEHTPNVTADEPPAEPATDESPAETTVEMFVTPPLSGHLETDHTRIHRAGVRDHHPTGPTVRTTSRGNGPPSAGSAEPHST